MENSLQNFKKRPCSLKKHLFKILSPQEVIVRDEVSLDSTLALGIDVILGPQKKRVFPKVRVFGKKIFSLEFEKAKRISAVRFETKDLVIEKLPYKRLFDSVDVIQTKMDDFVEKLAARDLSEDNN